MKVPFSWLKELVDVDITAQELEKRLFGCGFEVEELIDLSAGISRVVVGRITHLEKQEGTDHLYLCRVDCGDEYGHDLAITTGAPNIFEGALVPVALDGATLPGENGPVTIKARKMHGVMSNGMMCSGEELGLNDDLYPGSQVYGLLILNDDPNAVIGRDICEVAGLNDYIFDISLTANRPDCQSVLGIAREVAAILNKPLKMPALDYTTPAAPDDSIKVEVQAPDLCPRYMAHYVRNIRPSESPRWMRRHLALCGLRSINNVVDITNHTLLEMGQPMHAFDLSHVGGRHIIVRRAKNGEEIVTLDEKSFTLTDQNLVICDEEKPVALAGIMGGLNSEIEDDTTELLFECATFARDSVRKTSRALGQNSDSSARYEKGVDAYSTGLGLRRALHLIQELDCGDITPTCFDCCSDKVSFERRVITVSPEQIDAVLGIQVPRDTMKDILCRLDFGVDDSENTWEVSVPLYREDMDSFPDVAEEIIREYGYEHIVPTFLSHASVTNGGLSRAQQQQMKMKRLLAGQGFYEASTLAFYATADLDKLHFAPDAPERNAIRIKNPISEHLSIMRTTLAPSMLQVIVNNLKKGNSEGRLFEMSPVYLPYELPLARQPHERMTLCLGLFGPGEDFFTAKGAVEAIAGGFGLTFTYERDKAPYLHPGMTAGVLCEGKKVGVFGKLSLEVTAELDIARDERQNQNIYLIELDYEALSAHFPEERRYHPLPATTPVKRDLALVCEEAVTCGQLQDVIQSASPLVQDVQLFDIYRGKNLGEGKKSMAFTITLQNKEQEVAPADAERAIRKILGNLKAKLGVDMR